MQLSWVMGKKRNSKYKRFKFQVLPAIWEKFCPDIVALLVHDFGLPNHNQAISIKTYDERSERHGKILIHLMTNGRTCRGEAKLFLKKAFWPIVDYRNQSRDYYPILYGHMNNYDVSLLDMEFAQDVQQRTGRVIYWLATDPWSWILGWWWFVSPHIGDVTTAVKAIKRVPILCFQTVGEKTGKTYWLPLMHALQLSQFQVGNLSMRTPDTHQFLQSHRIK